MGKYFRQDRSKDAYISIRLLDKDGNVLNDYPAAGCHGVIKSTMNPKTACINTYRKKSLLPYDPTEIQRWVDDLNEMGFPCTFLNNEGAIGDDKKQELWVGDTINADLQDMALVLRRHGALHL